MLVKEVEEFIKKQKEQIQVSQRVEQAKIEGFYQGAAVALNAVETFINDTKKAEEASKEQKTSEKK